MLPDDALRGAVERLLGGGRDQEDVDQLRHALSNGSLTWAMGDRAVALGGTANDAVIVTGDGNVVSVVKSTDSAALLNALRLDKEAVRLTAQTAYLQALRDHANLLPYVVLRTNRTPSLSAVYVEQRPEQQQSSEGIAKRDEAPLSADAREIGIFQALESHRHLVLEAGPGMGKSTLLYHVASTMAQRYLVDGARSTIPVLVSSRLLAAQAGSLSEAVYAVATAELSQRLAAPLPPDMFANPPALGESWLILLDGLDETVDRRERMRLVETLRHYTSVSCPYRFLVTSRPLADASTLDDPSVGHYILRAFSTEQVDAFVANWFGSNSPATAVEGTRFLEKVRQSRVGDLAQVPLLLTMAATITDIGGVDSLPRSRAELYGRFVQILLEDEEVERGTRAEYVEAWSRRHGRSGELCADRLFEQRRLLIEDLALESQSEQREEFLAAATRAARSLTDVPSGVDETWLAQQVAILLGRTGLFVQHGSQYDFLHESLREYLAASALARSHDPSLPSARQYVGRWSDSKWKEIVLFLLGIWSQEGKGVTAVVQRICPASELPGFRSTSDVTHLLFVATALRDGVSVSPKYDEAIVRAMLARVKQMTHSQTYRHPNLLDVLTSLDRRPAVESGLDQLVRDATVDEVVRLEAAEQLERRGEVARAAAGFIALACDAAAGERVRSRSVENLQQLGRLDDLRVIASSRTGSGMARLRAAESMERLGRGDDAHGIMQALSRDLTLDPWVRLTAAEALAQRHHLEEAVAALHLLGRDERTPERTRMAAVEALERHGSDSDAADVLQELGRSARADPRTRLQIVQALEQRGCEEKALTVLTALADASTLSLELRLEIARAFERLGQPAEQLKLLRSLTRVPAWWFVADLRGRGLTKTWQARVEAAEAVARLGHTDEAAASLRKMVSASSPMLLRSSSAMVVLAAVVLLVGTYIGAQLLLTGAGVLLIPFVYFGVYFGLRTIPSLGRTLVGYRLANTGAVRLEAAVALGRMGRTVEAVKILRALIRDADMGDSALSLQASAALKRLSSENSSSSGTSNGGADEA